MLHPDGSLYVSSGKYGEYWAQDCVTLGESPKDGVTCFVFVLAVRPNDARRIRKTTTT